MVYDVAQSFVSMFTGITTALTRMILAIVMAIVTVPRLDRSAYPAWVSRYLNLDSGLQSYYGVIVQCHTFNNPIAVVFVSHLLEAVRVKRASQSPASSQAAVLFPNPLSTATPQPSAGENAGKGAGSTAVLKAQRVPAPTSSQRRRVAFRFQLAVLLLRVPQLRQYRDLSARARGGSKTPIEL